MSTRIQYFYGKSKWAKLGLGTDPSKNADDKYACWKIDLHMAPESWEAFEKSGLQLKVNVDETGSRYVTFRRPFMKLIKKELVKFDPPEVTTADGEKFKDFIGNDSTVIVKVNIFDTVKGKGHRLESVRVMELVKFGDSSEAIVIGDQEFVPF